MYDFEAQREKDMALVDLLVTARMVNYDGSPDQHASLPTIYYVTSCFTPGLLYPRERASVV